MTLLIMPIYSHMCVYVFLCVYIYIYICIHTHVVTCWPGHNTNLFHDMLQPSGALGMTLEKC